MDKIKWCGVAAFELATVANSNSYCLKATICFLILINVTMYVYVLKKWRYVATFLLVLW